MVVRSVVHSAAPLVAQKVVQWAVQSVVRMVAQKVVR